MKPASEAKTERGHPSLEYHIKDVGHYSGAAGTITVFRSRSIVLMVMQILSTPAVSVHPLYRAQEWLPQPLTRSHSETNPFQSWKGYLYT